MWDGTERRKGERRAIRPHIAQLRICHEQIAAPGHWTPNGPEVEETPKQYCNLRDVKWCIDDQRYVCEVHLNANHQGHRTLVE